MVLQILEPYWYSMTWYSMSAGFCHLFVGPEDVLVAVLCEKPMIIINALMLAK
jgi:hypothetical protein